MDSEHLEAYLANELDDNARRQVEHALMRDADLRDSFIKQMQLDSALQVLLGENAAEERSQFEGGVIARLQSEGAGDDRSFAKSVLTEIVEEREGIRPIHWPDLIKAGVIAAAASIALMFLLQKIIFREAPVTQSFTANSVQAPRAFLARMENSDDLKWSTDSKDRIRKDGWLSKGLIEIEEGTALIAFNSGATVVVESPSVISIESSNRLFLKSGRLTANVPPPASGFTVNTPRLNAVDIGTRFGVSVEENGDSELHVMQGKVEASRASGNSVTTLVREGLALRADSRTRTELQPVPYEGDVFTIRVGNLSSPEPILRYTFDESGGAVVEDSGSLRQFDVPLVGEGELDCSPRRSAGHVGGGLVFEPGDFLDVPLSRDFRVDEAHTISFWVKIPPILARVTDETILQYGREGLGWKVSCNFSHNAAARGALRIENSEGYMIGSTDLADGNWHHVAYRFLGGEDANLPSHLHIFVDSYPEQISEYVSGELDSGRAGLLRLGADSENAGLQGWIDEFAIYPEAIPTPVLQSLGK